MKIQDLMINQVWVHYEKWECYKNGMWRKLPKSDADDMLALAIEFTGNHVDYGMAMRKVIFAWPNSIKNALTNVSINQRAYVGHCAACYAHGIPEYITRKAWGFLTDEQRHLADMQASIAINHWKLWYQSAGQLKFEF